ncbi:MAG: isoprenylcysteine carboxylmethyltransferase family protein [Candidatus Sulfotelmatobacter sp.]|jgi:protein-S-isoprenylcysteine O-methyltransferase Ste14
MEGRQLYVFTAAQVIAVAAGLWLILSRPGPWDLQRGIGSVLVVVGIAGIAAARYHLGKSFAIRAEAHHLVTNGVYSKIRNPIYVFGVVMLAGFILVLHRPVLWFALAAIVVMQIVRARREAKVLEAAFGDAYREYRRKTWF